MSIDLSLGRAIKWNVPTNQGPLWILDLYPRMLHRSEESRLRAAFKRRLPDFSNSGKILIDSNPAQN
ncbi:hypothetical protein [Mesorhizobium sp.]|uniref:hypothetical protein n=1 Tax=Mesorhizobium sp. TaxID=1871066 RepID=UPI000FE3BBE8|nr:hypothetical protein [Mesorhizobium sp.]RWN55437.1 MAG: hypothetical protein EOR98_11485 [Mesorhizobium sp.]RWN77414.1 MAG: hypothetical protein EOS02_13010 [Mesorhizobium sp.]RWN80049.1 MAG: hypothetical protein EOS01_11550 [Mesorhizobium sp.]RWN87316.1 MAG: hypothetical protein EOS04_16350 [Mesorhizobium sp.]RWO15150.1 MAG: hypothetical protein EOS15_12785 [Mesorhizobium sp.]